MKKTPLKRGKRLNTMSPRKIAEINGEYGDRVRLCFRCGGQPVTSKKQIKLNNGQSLELRTVTCLGGICEYCGKPAQGQTLHPHEKIPRARGGKLSIENSLMVHDYPCHDELQNNT